MSDSTTSAGPERVGAPGDPNARGFALLADRAAAWSELSVAVADAQQQPGFPLAAEQSAATGAKLMQAEGLGHEVVGAVIQTTHARFDFLSCG